MNVFSVPILDVKCNWCRRLIHTRRSEDIFEQNMVLYVCPSVNSPKQRITYDRNQWTPTVRSNKMFAGEF